MVCNKSPHVLFRKLLEILDGLDAEFKKLSELAVPEKYKSIEELADEASTNMSNAINMSFRVDKDLKRQQEIIEQQNEIIQDLLNRTAVWE